MAPKDPAVVRHARSCLAVDAGTNLADARLRFGVGGGGVAVACAGLRWSRRRWRNRQPAVDWPRVPAILEIIPFLRIISGFVAGR